MLMHKNKAISRLKTGGIVLGFVPEFEYAEEKIQFEPGTTLLIYSDGITEAMNSEEEEFGDERLLNILSENIDSTAETIIQKIIEQVNMHVGEMPQMDDMTLLVIKREK